MSLCRRCGGEIVWVRTKGKMVACEKDGEVVCDQDAKMVLLKLHRSFCPAELGREGREENRRECR